MKDDNKDFKEQFKNAIVSCCISFSEHIGQLFDYFLINLAAIKENFAKEKQNNETSFKILSLFNSVYKCKTEKERKERAEEIKNAPVSSKYKLFDLFSELSFSEKEMGFEFVFNQEIKDRKLYSPSTARRIMKKYGYMYSCLQKSILSSLISTYESFLSCVYTALIHNNPSIYFCSKTITLQSLIRKDVDEIINEQIDEIVEADMFDSIETTKKIFEKEKICLGEIKDLFDRFCELYYRRNIFVHNEGIVNQMYLKSIPSSLCKIGTSLKCDKEYFAENIINIQKIMFFIVFKLLEKEKPSENNVDELLDYYFEKLANKEYILTSFVYKVLSSSKKLDFATKMIAKVNLLLSLKYSSQNDSFDKEIATFDVSAAEIQFKIAKLILLDNYKDAAILIEQSYSSDKTPNELINWPLFLQFRDTIYYNEIVNNHIGDFKTEELSGDDKNQTSNTL